jgi:hypothetical protein
MPFTLPPDVVPGVRSKNTVAMYKSRLNKIASEGYDDIDKLLKAPTKVIKKINEMHTYDDEKQTKSKRLEMLTAVFYALQNVPADNRKKLIYYKAFQKNKTTYTSPAELRKTDPTYRTKKEEAM